MIFRNWVLENFPFLEDDFDALTDYELFCKMLEYVKQFAKDNEEFKKQLEEMENYLNNLDLQDEVDNKIDELYENGDLAEIITTYLNIAGVLAFNTKADLKSATNLVDGSVAKTLGTDTYNDGYGCLYKVRELVNTDVVDDDNIVALTNYPTLIAEKIIEKTIYNSKKPVNMNKVIFIGDSYGQLSGQNTWIDVLINKLGLSSSDYIRKTEGSTGFANYNAVSEHRFIDLLEDAIGDIPSSDVDLYTHVIVGGGANDIGASITTSELNERIEAFINYAKTNLPNANVYIGQIGFTIETTVKKNFKKVLACYTNCKKYGGIYLNGVENSSHYYPYFKTEGVYSTSNTVHPNQDGSYAIGNAMYEALMTGYSTTYRDWELVSDSIAYQNLYSSSNNGTYRLKLASTKRATISGTSSAISSLTLSPSNPIVLMDFSNGCVGGVSDPTPHQITIQIDDTSNNIYVVNGYLCLENYVYNNTIRQKMVFYPHQLSPSTTGGYQKITNAYYYYITPTILEYDIYDC